METLSYLQPKAVQPGNGWRRTWGRHRRKTGPRWRRRGPCRSVCVGSSLAGRVGLGVVLGTIEPCAGPQLCPGTHIPLQYLYKHGQCDWEWCDLWASYLGSFLSVKYLEKRWISPEKIYNIGTFSRKSRLRSHGHAKLWEGSCIKYSPGWQLP